MSTRASLDRPLIVVATILVYWLFSMGGVSRGSILIPGFAGLSPIAGLPVTFGFLFGHAGALGAGIGYVIATSGIGSLSLMTLLFGGIHALTAYTAYRLRRPVSVTLTVDQPPLRFRGQALQFGIVTLVSSMVAAGGAGWVNAIGRRAPFFVAVTVTFVDVFIMTILIGLPVVLIDRVVRRWIPILGRPGDDAVGTPRLVAVETLFWLIIGTMGSLGMVAVGFIPDWVFGNYGLAFLLPIFDLVGPDGIRFQIVFGAFMLSLIVLSLYGGDQVLQRGIR